jgi:hypothetical protein
MTPEALLNMMNTMLAEARRGKFISSETKMGLGLSSEETKFKGVLLRKQ